MKNIEKFLSILDGEADGLLLTSRYSRHYGAEFDIAEGMAIVTKKGCRYFTDSRYIESAQNNIKDFEVLDVQGGRNYAKCINEAIADFGVTALGFEEDYLTVAEFRSLEQNLHAKLVPFNAKINGFRGMKEPWEIERMRKAQKIADQILCVKGDHVCYYGTPEQIFEEQTIRELYGIENGFYDPRFGSIELPKVDGEPEVFVIAGCGRGIPIYRKLQKDNIPFATGILYTNDVDYQLARLLATEVIIEEPFCQITQEHLQKAMQVMEKCKKVICTDVPIGECNKGLEELVLAAKKRM